MKRKRVPFTDNYSIKLLGYNNVIITLRIVIQKMYEGISLLRYVQVPISISALNLYLHEFFGVFFQRSTFMSLFLIFL